MSSDSAARRSFRNLVWGIVCQIIVVAFGILVPRLVLVSYGSEVNGLLNSVIQIFSYFALFEAGIGAVALQFLYKSVGEGNQKATNSILSAVHKYYRRIGMLYATAVVLLSIIYPLAVQSDIPFWTVFLVIILNGISPVANFLFQGKYILLLQAEGKIYILNAINTTINILTSIAKIALLTNGFDVVMVQFSVALVSLFQMAYIGYYVHRHYQWIDLKVTPNLQALTQSKNAFVHQVTSLFGNSLNILLLTLFAGLKDVSIYAMYMLLFGMIRTFMNTANSSITFVLGQSFNTNRTTFMRLESMYETFYIGIICLLYTIAAIFIRPFLTLYTEGADDANYEMPYLPLLFLIMNVMTYIRMPGAQVINFAGHFQKTQGRAIAEAGIRLGVSFTLVHSMGIYGVLIGTIASLIYRTNDTLLYVAHRILHISAKPVYAKAFVFCGLSALLLITSEFLHPDLNSYVNIVLFSALYSVCALVPFALAALLIDKEATSALYNLLFKCKTHH